MNYFGDSLPHMTSRIKAKPTLAKWASK